MKTLEKSTAAIYENGKITNEKTAKKPVAGKAPQRNGTAAGTENASDKHKGPTGETQNKKGETTSPDEKEGHRALNLDSTLEVVETLHRRKLQRDRLLATLETLEAFDIAQKDSAEETGGSHFQGCILTIMDDKREEFTTKNPFLIDKVAMLLKFLCEDKLAEIEAELVLPR